jgi:2-polyprenyl-6-methoxyphenol hydroxylase-like FAD-dependent oxidoreductase
LFGNAVEYGDLRDKSATGGDKTESEPNGRGSASDHRGEYVMWGFSARRKVFASPNDLESLSGEELKASVLALMEGWHPATRYMVQSADVSTITAFAVKTSVPIPPWRTRNVTLLGDALHNMTPFRGIGANTALRDAAALRQALVAIDRGEQDLIPALSNYERDMVDYGFRAVRTSLREMERLHSENSLSRTFTKTVSRTIDLIAPLKTVLYGGQ